MKRVLAALGLALTLLVTISVGPAAAVEIIHDRNTYGQYDCQLKFPKNDQYVDYLCNVIDEECDGYGVFVELKIYMDMSNDNKNTVYFRVTPNAGGCGNGKYAKDYKRWDTGWGSEDIDQVCARLTKDVPMGNDKPYKGTTDCVNT
ncbi:MAG: hypothetical protein ACXWW7_03550 [Nocardioides sp.]